jgi:nonribosomal peptide synthetase protein BlmVIII
MIQRRARGETDAAIAARVTGTLALREAIAGQHPDFVLLCSSIGTVLHKLKFGEVGYLASHAFLNAYAEAAAAAGEPVVAVAWTDWLETGMWAEAQQRLRERYAVTATGAGGLHPAADLLAGITTAEAVEVFDRIVGAGLSGAVVVSTQDLDVLLGRHEAFEAARHDVLAGDLRLRGTHRERPPLPTPHVPPAGATQAAVAALWTQLLGVRDPGADDDFFDLGGDSLLALRFLGRLREETGVDHPVARFFEAPTVRAVASAVEGAPAAGGAP